VLLPVCCAACRRAGRDVLCADCVSALAAPPDVAPPPGLDRTVALCAYEGAGRAVVVGLKFANQRAVAEPAGRAMARAWIDACGDRRVVPDVVTWAPTTSAHRRRRGYDQSRLLARWVGAELGIPVRGVLRRTGGSQVGLDRGARLGGPTFSARGVPLHVLVVDDVRTTGATLAAAAAALRVGGARRVEAVTLAATP